jgi:RHS repeat-associated protein
VVTPEGLRVRFTYDAFGRRVRKDVLPTVAAPSDLFTAPPAIAPTPGRKSIHFLWDGDVLCEEQDSSKEEPVRKRVHVHVPGTFVPIAQVERGEMFGVVNDHLGMPKELVDASGRVAWRATHGAWGGLLAAARDAGAAEVESPFRLLGQYADEESGLCHTKYRYFESTTGRWLSPDPLEISGGANLTAFDGSPTTHQDPLGLATGPCSEKAIREAIARLRDGKEVRVKTIEEARAILERMTDLRPHTFDRRTPVPPNEGGHSNPLWRQPDGTWRADLINRQDPGGPIHPELPPGHPHRDLPHYNVRLPDGTKSAIIITG